MKLFKLKKENTIEWADIIYLGYGFQTQLPAKCIYLWLILFGFKIKLLKKISYPHRELTEQIFQEFKDCKNSWMDNEGIEMQTKLNNYRNGM